MQKIILLLLLVCLCPKITICQQLGKVIESRNVKSKVLNRDIAYAVYLPADYSTSERAYPVVYLLHGLSGDNTQWIQWGEINRYADKAIADGTIPPMIIIMPNANRGWYMNSFDGKVKYEDFFIKEFIPTVEKTYRIKAEKAYRGIAGLSMGGYGTLLYALKFPDMFSAAASLSAGVYDDVEITEMPDSDWLRIYGQVFNPTLQGKNRLNKTWYNNSILELVKVKSTEDISKVRYWIDCGDDDFLTKGNGLLHHTLTQKKVPHEFRVRDGAHNWTYWRSGITDALKFIGDSFHRF